MKAERIGGPIVPVPSSAGHCEKSSYLDILSLFFESTSSNTKSPILSLLFFRPESLPIHPSTLKIKSKINGAGNNACFVRTFYKIPAKFAKMSVLLKTEYTMTSKVCKNFCKHRSRMLHRPLCVTVKLNNRVAIKIQRANKQRNRSTVS